MFYAPRYTDPTRKDLLTGFMYIHPFVYGEIRDALTKVSAKKKAKVRVDLRGDGDRGKAWLVDQYVATGLDNKGNSVEIDQAEANSMTFWLKKGKITKYRLDSTNDAYDFTLNPRSLNPESGRLTKSPIPLNDIFAMSDLFNQGKIGDMYYYADNYLWPTYYRYSDVGQPGNSLL
ncbi:MAG: hypothetical protein R6W06_07075 [Prochlorococcaceae cyanobacterium]